MVGDLGNSYDMYDKIRAQMRLMMWPSRPVCFRGELLNLYDVLLVTSTTENTDANYLVFSTNKSYFRKSPTSMENCFGTLPRH